MQVVLHIFSQVMHFIVAWSCAVWGGGTGHPTPFNSWFSTPHSGGMGFVVHGHVCMQVYVCVCVHPMPALHEDPTSLWADNCTYSNELLHKLMGDAYPNSILIIQAPQMPTTD
jgi:hypothetical protein